MTKNLLDGLFEEMNRNRELLKVYEEIGPPGVFGHAMIQQKILAGEKAIAGGDVVEMVQAFKALQDSQ